MVTSGYQFMNLKFVHLSKKHANRTPTFGNGFWHTENNAEGGSSIPLILAKETISVLRNFCNHPEKGGKMSQKQSASACTRRIHSELGIENKLAFRNYIIYLYLQQKKNSKG